jgi:hypothetical protein
MDESCEVPAFQTGFAFETATWPWWCFLWQVLRFPWSPSTPLMGLSFASQPGLLQGDVHGMANSDMFRTLMQSFSQEPPTQVCSLAWFILYPHISQI